MNKTVRKLGMLVPFVRKYLKLDAEEKELLPKVHAHIDRIMREGTPEEKKRITGKIRKYMEKYKVEIPA